MEECYFQLLACTNGTKSRMTSQLNFEKETLSDYF